MHKNIHAGNSGSGNQDSQALDRETAIKIAGDFIKELSKLPVHLRKAIMFGSAAADRLSPDSDIDIALVADEFTGFGWEDRDYYASINIRKPYSIIQTKTFQTEYFEKGDPFIGEIIRTGVLLYEA